MAQLSGRVALVTGAGTLDSPQSRGGAGLGGIAPAVQPLIARDRQPRLASGIMSSDHVASSSVAAGAQSAATDRDCGRSRSGSPLEARMTQS